MKIKFNRPMHGDYGLVQAGQVIDLNEFQVREMQELEAAGLIERVREPSPFKGYTVQTAKALPPLANKMLASPPQNKAR